MPGKGEPKTIDDEFKDTSEEEFDNDQEEIEDKILLEVDEEVRTEINNTKAEIDKISLNVDRTLDLRLLTDGIETKYSKIDEKFKSLDKRYQTFEDFTKEQKDKVAKESRAARKKMVRRIILVVLGIATAAGTGIYYLIKMNQDKQPQPDGDFTQDQANQVKKVLEDWRAKPDADFWKSLADYVKANKPSLQFQMEMMAYVKNWAATPPEITWGDTEKGGDIQALIDAVTNGSQADIYTTVATLKHEDVLLARAVAADLCENAAANLLAANDAGSGDASAA